MKFNVFSSSETIFSEYSYLHCYLGGVDNAISMIHLINSSLIDGDHNKVDFLHSELNGDEYSTFGSAIDSTTKSIDSGLFRVRIIKY